MEEVKFRKVLTNIQLGELEKYIDEKYPDDSIEERIAAKDVLIKIYEMGETAA